MITILSSCSPTICGECHDNKQSLNIITLHLALEFATRICRICSSRHNILLHISLFIPSLLQGNWILVILEQYIDQQCPPVAHTLSFGNSKGTFDLDITLVSTPYEHELGSVELKEIYHNHLAQEFHCFLLHWCCLR